MNEKGISEIRRRLRPEKNSITHVRGCYVNENKEIVSQYDQGLALMSEDECDAVLKLLKKTLTGAVGKNLVDIEFTTEQVMNGEEHKLLTELRNTGLDEDEPVEKLLHKIIDNLDLDTNYLILLANDKYDISHKSGDVFNYIICSICPIKPSKPQLSFQLAENEFQGLAPDCIVGAPELGFMFPAFDDRATNIYNALYYTKDIASSRDEFIAAVFNTPVPIPAQIQREVFTSILTDTLDEDCKHDVIQAVGDKLNDIVTLSRETKGEEPPIVTKEVVQRVLEDCGVAESRVEAFTARYDDEFGAETELRAGNISGAKIEYKTEDITVQVTADRSDLVETRVIDGKKYILARIENDVELNGVPIIVS